MNFFQTVFIILIAGIIFIFVGELFFYDITGLGQKKALREFPIMAKRLGLKKKQGEVIETWITKKHNYNLVITPYNGATIILEMKQIPELTEISTTKGEINFSIPNQKFNRIFKERNIKKPLISKIEKAVFFQNTAIGFAEKWQKKSSYIEIRTDTIDCSLKYGLSSYIPAAVLKQIIPDMVELADAIQHDLGSK